MADNDITIGIKTTGAETAAAEIRKVEDAGKDLSAPVKPSTGFGGMLDKIPKSAEDARRAIEKIPDAIDEISASANKAEKSIFKIEDAVKKAEREMDVLEAKRRATESASGKTGGLLDVDVSGGAQKLGQEAADYAGFGQQFRAVSQLISADAVAVAGSFVAIGAAAVVSYDMLDETVERWREFETELKARGEELGEDLAAQIASIETLISPVKTVITSVSDGLAEIWKVAKDPVGELTGLNDLKESLAEQDRLLNQLNATRLKMANETGSSLSKVYQDEADGLKEQEQTLQRIATLRGQLQSIEQQRANRGIKIAQQDGGDVALAEANALAVRLKVEVAKLSENLRQSQSAVTIAQQAQSTAYSAYTRALTDSKDKLNPAEFKELSDKLDATNKELQKSKDIANEQARLFADAKLNVAEDVEVALIDLRDKYKGSVTKEAGKAFKSIEDSLKETLASGPTAAIEQIKVEVGTITTAAADKVTEVKTSLDGERTGTVAQIQTLTPNPQDTQAITKAVQDVGTGLSEQGNAFLSALNGLTAGITSINNRINHQQSQINHLFSLAR
jgi:hypothetical protein